jgi:hypothetical protein
MDTQALFLGSSAAPEPVEAAKSGPPVAWGSLAGGVGYFLSSTPVSALRSLRKSSLHSNRLLCARPYFCNALGSHCDFLRRGTTVRIELFREISSQFI